jgi:hypothetical protein
MKAFVWTAEADARLRELLQRRFTYSGCAQQLGARRIEVEIRAAELFGPIPFASNARAVIQARRAAA